jgi:glycosyltransferase involved in cell wall biosynthesis
MVIGYLCNQYPKVSHAFIRREILALESLGQPVVRYSIRSSGDELVDPADRSEQQRTRGILDAGFARLAMEMFRTAITQSGAWFTALFLAWRIGRKSDRGLWRHLAYLAEACLLKRWLAQDGCRHLHAHFGTNPATVAMFCRQLGGPPYSFTVHGPEEFDKALLLSLKEKIDRAAFVVAISDFGRGQLMRWCRPRQWEKIHVVRCGVDAAFFDSPSKPIPRASRLVCVGRLCGEKGQLLLVEALGQLAREGVPFEMTLVGDGEARSDVETAMRFQGIARQCTITGWATGAQVRQHLADARALVLPSLAEGLPVVLMEALALGRPVVSTYVAGIPELVEPGVNGWLVPSGSVCELVKAIREVLQAPADQLERFGHAGAEKARRLHDAAQGAAQLAALFNGQHDEAGIDS